MKIKEMKMAQTQFLSVQFNSLALNSMKERNEEMKMEDEVILLEGCGFGWNNYYSINDSKSQLTNHVSCHANGLMLIDRKRGFNNNKGIRERGIKEGQYCY